MSNVKRGERAVNDGDRPLKFDEKIVEQEDGSVLSVIPKPPREFFDEKTGEVILRPTSDARTSRVDMPGDRADGLKPWYLKHMIPCAARAQNVAREAEAVEVEAEARKAFEAKRDAKRPINPIRVAADKKAKAEKKAAVQEVKKGMPKEKS